MAPAHHILGLLGFLVVVTLASYEYSEFANLGSVDHELHHRSKRAANYPSSPINPTNVTFYLFRIGDNENLTALSVGTYVRFQLVIHFPVGTTDMLVELFTPDNDTTIMKLCNPQVTHMGPMVSVDINGSIYDTAKLNSIITKEGKTPTTKDYDRAIIPMGNVTVAGGSSAEDGMVKIEWDAVMLDDPSLVDGKVYWSSAGAEYNNAEEVWIGQGSNTGKVDSSTSTNPPAANFTGPSQMELGSSAEFKVDVYIPHPAVELTFDAFAPLNHSGVMSVCSIAITDTGKNYDCLDRDKAYTLYEATDGKGNERGRLALGKVINKDARKGILADGRITIEFVMYLFDNATFLGNSYLVGAAIQIGTQQIWAGQLSFTAIATTSTAMTIDPVFVSWINSSTTVGVGDTVNLAINMTVPKNQPGIYELEVLAPYSDFAPQLRICKVLTVFHGANVPCITDVQPLMLARDNNTDRADRSTWKLGKITNFGNILPSDIGPAYVTPDTISFAVPAEVLDHTQNTAGATLSLTAGMKFTDQKLWIGSGDAQIGTDATNVSSQTPTFNMYFWNTTNPLYINQSAHVYLEMTTEPNTMYRITEMEFIMPFEDGAPVLSVCRVEIIFVGMNFPCFDQAKYNASFNYTSKSNDTKQPDKALISLGQISNMGYSSDPKENTIIFAFVFKVLDHPRFATNVNAWASVGMRYSDTIIWVGQLQATIQAGAPTSLPPHIATVRYNDPGNMILAKGGVAVYHVIVKVPALSSSKYIFSATGTANLKICSVKLLEFGTNLPCVRDDLNATVNGLTTDLDLGVVTNVGEKDIVLDSTFDNDTLRVQVIAQLENVDAVAVGSGGHTLTITVDNGASAGWASPAPFVFTAGDQLAPNSSNETNPTFDFNVYSVEDVETNITTNKVAKGEAKLVRLDIRPKHDTVNSLNVKFLTPVNTTGEMEICNINVVHVGLNMPCNKREIYNGTGTFQSRYNSTFQDIAGIDLGFVCYQQLYDEPEEGKITVEAVVKLLSNTTFTTTTDFAVSAAVNINGDQIYVSSNKLALMDIKDFVSTAVNSSHGGLAIVEATDTLLKWRPGSVNIVPFSFEIPPNSSTVASVQVSTIMDTTAVMTVRDVRITGAGVNIGCVNVGRIEVEYPLWVNSTVKTTQMDRGYRNLFVITNSGVSDRMNARTLDDDKIFFEAEVQMADAVINTKSSIKKLAFGGTVGPAVYVLEKDVEVIRDGLEEPLLQLNATSNDTLTYDVGSPINISALLYHEVNSSAEAYNVDVYFYYSKLLKFLNVTFCNFTYPTAQEITVPGNGVKLTFAQLLFTDVAEFGIQLGVNDQTVPPFGLPPTPDIQTPFETASTKIYRPIDTYPTGYVFVTRMDSLSYRVSLPPDGGCGTNPLGLQDSRIQDCQIDGSYTPDPTTTPAKARKGTTGMFKSAVRKGHFDKYVDYNFGNMTRVTGVTLEHPGGNRVTEFQAFYSDDGMSWIPGEKVTPSPGYATTLNLFNAPRDARYLRLLILNQEGGADAAVSFRAEVHGCTTLGDISITDVCQTKPWENIPKSPDMVSRGFLATSTTVYYCDAVNQEGDMKCFSRSDPTINTWKELDPVVVNALGYLPSKNELYGIANDKRSYLVSPDDGSTWSSISKARFDQMKLEIDFIPQLPVEWVLDATVADTNPSTTLTRGAYAAGYSGIYKDSSKIADWTTCCAP